MIKITNKTNCCGCHACYSICPKNAIEMHEDENGFKYPIVDNEKCIKCGLCEKVCPIKNKEKIINNPIAYACINNDEQIRQESSSGGIFTLVAEEIIKLGGVVFGVKFDESFNVIHGYTENEEGLKQFRGSKYVQSIIGNTYKEAKKFLDEDRYVLFTGTPCQIEGLYSYLHYNYDKLYTQDIICHGVPSPKVWQKYVKFRKQKDNNDIKKIEFRNKAKGWQNFSMKFTYREKIYIKDLIKDKYMQAFLNNLCLRDSCYNCSFKKISRISDLTLADFWGIQNIRPEMNDDKGTSLVIINSEKGKEIFNSIKGKINYCETNFNEAIKYNTSINMSAKVPQNREAFFKNIDKLSFDKLFNKYILKEKIFKNGIRILKIIEKIKKSFKKNRTF